MIRRHRGRWWQDLVEFLLPGGCVVCGAWMPRPTDGERTRLLTCSGCRSRPPAAPHPRCPRCHLPRATGRLETPDCRICRGWPAVVDAARWAWTMAPPADALVHALKYQGWPELAEEMGRDMARALRSAPGPPPDLVTSVPTTEARLARRGYNQATLLGRAVAEVVEKPFAESLVRTRGGDTQVALPPSRRWANVDGAFAASPLRKTGFDGSHVVLADDVLTTGATAVQAATVLRGLGAGRVTVLTYARALPEPIPGSG